MLSQAREKRLNRASVFCRSEPPQTEVAAFPRNRRDSRRPETHELVSNLKVLHVLNHSIPHLDGYCIRSKSIVLCQRAQGLDPVVVTSPHHEPLTSGPVEAFDDIRYYRMKKSNGSRFTGFHEAAVIWRMANRIGEVIRDEAPDLIHAHSPCTWGVAALIAARKARLPVAYEARGRWEGQSSSGTPRLKYRLARRREALAAAFCGRGELEFGHALLSCWLSFAVLLAMRCA